MDQRLASYAAIIVGIWIVQVLYRAATSPLRRVPGPLYTNITRLPLKLSIITGRRIYFVHRLHQQYGRIVRISPDEVSVSSPDGFKEIHRVGSPFLKTEWYQQLAFDQKPGIFAMRDAKEHAARRRLFARPFSKSELRRTWEPVVKEKARLAVEQIRRELRTDGKADVLKWWTFMATDVSGQLMFGESFDMLRYGKKNEYIRILESVMMGSGINLELPLVGLIGRYIPLPAFQAMFRSADYMTQYGQRAIANARSTSSASRNIFSSMIHESEKDNAVLTDEDVAAEAGNLIVAGSDTTAITLTYLVWAVLCQPNLQHSLEEEVVSLGDDFNEEALEALPLLNAVIEETLRLYGAAPGGLPRAIPDGGATISGYYLPSGITVSTQSYTTHRDEGLYRNPERFDVTRWLNEEHSEQAKQGFSPFGAGARTCLGIHLAWMELRLAATEFFREARGVRLAPSTTWESMKPENYFLIAPSGHQCEIVDSRSDREAAYQIS